MKTLYLILKVIVYTDMIQDKFEDTKGVITSRKSKDKTIQRSKDKGQKNTELSVGYRFYFSFYDFQWNFGTIPSRW